MDGRAAGEARGLLAFERSELGHFDEQGKGGDFRDAGDGENNLKAPGALSVAVDTLFDGGVDLLDFDANGGDTVFVLLFEQGQRNRLGAILAAVRSLTRVGAIGFHELAGGLGEAARLARIDRGDEDAGPVQRALDPAMVRAGGFENDTRHRRCGEPFDQGFAAGFILGETAGRAVGEPVRVKTVFRERRRQWEKGSSFPRL